MLKLEHGNKTRVPGKTDRITQHQEAQAANLVADLVAFACVVIDRAGSRDPGDHQFRWWGSGCRAPGGCVHHHDHHAHTGDRHRGIGRSWGHDLYCFICAQETARGRCEGASHQHPGEQYYYGFIWFVGKADHEDA